MSDLFSDLFAKGDDIFANLFKNNSHVLKHAMRTVQYIAEGGKLYRGKPAEPEFSEWLAEQEAKDKNKERVPKLEALARDRGATKHERMTARRMAKKLRGAA